MVRELHEGGGGYTSLRTEQPECDPAGEPAVAQFRPWATSPNSPDRGSEC